MKKNSHYFLVCFLTWILVPTGAQAQIGVHEREDLEACLPILAIPGLSAYGPTSCREATLAREAPEIWGRMGWGWRAMAASAYEDSGVDIVMRIIEYNRAVDVTRTLLKDYYSKSLQELKENEFVRWMSPVPENFDRVLESYTYYYTRSTYGLVGQKGRYLIYIYVEFVDENLGYWKEVIRDALSRTKTPPGRGVEARIGPHDREYLEALLPSPPPAGLSVDGPYSYSPETFSVEDPERAAIWNARGDLEGLAWITYQINPFVDVTLNLAKYETKLTENLAGAEDLPASPVPGFDFAFESEFGPMPDYWTHQMVNAGYDLTGIKGNYIVAVSVVAHEIPSEPEWEMFKKQALDIFYQVKIPEERIPLWPFITVGIAATLVLIFVIWKKRSSIGSINQMR